MEKNIYCGRGYRIPHADFMDLINTSFGFLTSDIQFIDLLPKCYREPYRPQDSNYVVTEDGVLTAAVGAYDHELMVCGRRLPCRGIGNVAVHPDHRSKGYMKDAMNAALRDMVADGIVLSTLGGRRQRYQYFGYDKAGPIYTFEFSRENCRHLFGDYSSPYEVKLITDPADPIIDKIIALNGTQPVTPVRPREQYLDIANTWKANLLVFLDGDRFVGYCIADAGVTLSEVQTVNKTEFMNLLRSVLAYLGESFKVCLPAHQADYIRDLAPVAESQLLGSAMHFNVFNYSIVTEAFLALKLTYEKLPDGEMTLLIHGFAGDERIRVSVKNGKASVESVEEMVCVDYELSHLEAITFLFSPICPTRDAADDLAKLWFPLPICMYHADEV